ncbi:MAG TPA: methionyl-tRNA formyltransferase [Polyangia bacterium]|nr:methionyl-tRNA formyltransferase [Polyangia bacterium]
MTRLKVVFMGSPEFAVPALERLLESADVRAVVTQPDRPKGRGRALAPPPVKQVATRARLPVLQPERIKGNQTFLDELRALAPELIVVVAYGRILPPALLELPPRGCINVHASLLPRYRGAAPIQWAIARGERETGVSIMQMDAGMDTGPVLLQHRCAIDDRDTAGSLSEKLARLGADALDEALRGLADGTVRSSPQDEAAATYAPRLEKHDGSVDFEKPARAVRDWIRAMDPWPGAFVRLADEPVRLFSARLVSGAGVPGTVLGADRDGLLVACGQGAIGIGELQLPGRKRIPARALLAGHPIPIGTVLRA